MGSTIPSGLGKRVFSTGQAARICGVAPRTISKWCDAGQLQAYRIPGSMDRRIHRESLIRFLRDNHMPTDMLTQVDVGDATRILTVTPCPLLADAMAHLLLAANGYFHEHARTLFEAGCKVTGNLPDVLILDFSLGRGDSLGIAQALRQNATGKEITIIALASEDEENLQGLFARGFNLAWKKPVDVALVAQAIRTFADPPEPVVKPTGKRKTPPRKSS